MEGQIPSARSADGRGVLDHGEDAIEMEVARARVSFEQGLREASRVGTRAARRVVTPALIGAGLVGGALVLLALVRLARRSSNGALIRVVVETPASPKRMLPAVSSAVLRWVLERQLRGHGPLGALLAALADPRSGRVHAGRAVDPARGLGHYES
jgi:hypothetical protein